MRLTQLAIGYSTFQSTLHSMKTVVYSIVDRCRHWYRGGHKTYKNYPSSESSIRTVGITDMQTFDTSYASIEMKFVDFMPVLIVSLLSISLSLWFSLTISPAEGSLKLNYGKLNRVNWAQGSLQCTLPSLMLITDGVNDRGSFTLGSTSRLHGRHGYGRPKWQLIHFLKIGSRSAATMINSCYLLLIFIIGKWKKCCRQTFVCD